MRVLLTSKQQTFTYLLLSCCCWRDIPAAAAVSFSSSVGPHTLQPQALLPAFIGGPRLSVSFQQQHAAASAAAAAAAAADRRSVPSPAAAAATAVAAAPVVAVGASAEATRKQQQQQQHRQQPLFAAQEARCSEETEEKETEEKETEDGSDAREGAASYVNLEAAADAAPPAAAAAAAAAADRVPLTEAAVEDVLNQIRPYLQSHGGAVSLVNLNKERRTVTVQLQVINI